MDYGVYLGTHEGNFSAAVPLQPRPEHEPCASALRSTEHRKCTGREAIKYCYRLKACLLSSTEEIDRAGMICSR